MNNLNNTKDACLTGGTWSDYNDKLKTYGYCERLKDKHFRKHCHNASKTGKLFIKTGRRRGYEIHSVNGGSFGFKSKDILKKYRESKELYLKSKTKGKDVKGQKSKRLLTNKHKTNSRSRNNNSKSKSRK